MDSPDRKIQENTEARVWVSRMGYMLRPRSSHSSVVDERSTDQEDGPGGLQPSLHSDTWGAPTFNALDPFAPSDPIPIWSDVSTSILFPAPQPTQGHADPAPTASAAIRQQDVGTQPLATGLSQRARLAEPVSPDGLSEAGSVLETTRGVALITLEAAAEPHYVGESSGYLWTTIVAKGLQAPTPPADRHKGPASPTRERSPSPRRHAILRAQLERQVPEETATTILESVYKHLHARVGLDLLLYAYPRLRYSTPSWIGSPSTRTGRLVTGFCWQWLRVANSTEKPA